ncbi:hypothetical protein [Streptomyces cinereoruber]|uniref:hypothetical protein n=1 Tax=Streptomyces cinereoruber TaxID=67260 RepID=UPI0036623424
MKILLAAPGATRRGWRRALQRAATALDAAHDDQTRYPALWHDKTLYAPTAMIRAETITARELLRRGLAQRTEGTAL